MKNLVLKKHDIAVVKDLLSLCPDSFSFVPLRLYKNEEGSFVSIETVDLTGSVIFSGNVFIDDLDLEMNTCLVVRLPLNKNVVNTIFGSDFDEIKINKNRILAQNDQIKLTFSLFNISDSDVLEFPSNNEDLYKTVREENNLSEKDDNYHSFIVNTDYLKNLTNYISLLSNLETITFFSKNGELMVSGEDYSLNKFEFRFETKDVPEFMSVYDISIVNIINKIIKFKDEHTYVNILVSNIMIAFMIYRDGIETTIAMAAKEK